MIPPGCHDAEQAGRLVGKSKSWMYQQGAAGNIPRSKLGHHVFWTDEQIAEIIRGAAQEPQQRKAETRPATQKRTPQTPPRDTPRKRPAPPTANNKRIPVADRSVSRLYRQEG
ncbi:hypothetical protein [Nonomuraea rubra]|uniref:Putative DNA-binding transcriptional regulator AlpA n=1 Tax=Nonomuraea rubra TaxID=46180 RepID=A0A7X0P6P0_9ACTN|nr:hypothetical protein [Nonomuraea rubra]MBB6556256.1 putative DNA-binding transcriptional regulator AlpA [Nonomuraea rubra]